MLTTNFNEILIRDAADSPKLKPAGRKIVIAASGSRGDIQPYVALGIHLKARGNDVVIATEQRTKYVVEEYNLAHACLAGDPTGVLFEASSQEILKNGNLVKLMKITEEWDKQWPKDDVLASYVTACSGADLIIAAGLTMTQTYCVAEMMNIPWIPMILGPTLPTCEFPIWALANLIPCSCLNKWSYGVLFSMLWNQEKKFINPWRIKHLGEWI
jgi:sterol 3beta-glucosyltransferase